MAKRRMKGDGAVYFDEKRGLYIGQVNLGYDEYGKRKRKTVYGKTKTEVRDKMKSVDYQIFTGTFTDDSDITFYHLAKQILDDKLNQNEIKQATYSRHIETLKALKEMYNTPLQDCHETQIRNFINSKLNYSQSQINKMYDLLKKTFKEALHRHIIISNPMEHIKKPHTKQIRQEVRALTKDEQKRLIDLLLSKDIQYSEQMLLSLSTGMRMGEVNALTVEDVNFAFNRITVRRTISRSTSGAAYLSDTTKTAAGNRVLIMTDSTAELLRDCIGDKKDGLIFTHNDKLVSTSQVSAQFRRIMKKYDFIDETVKDGKIDLHSLRHTFGTRCAEAGMPPKVLQKIMGHTDISITMNTYFYATNDYLEENVYKIDNILNSEGLTIAKAAPEKQRKSL